MAVWYGSKNKSSWVAGKRFSINEPFLTMMAKGLAGDSIGHWFIYSDNMQQKSESSANKPPFKIPAIAEIKATPWNGYKVASTFSGAGGSCTGYRMAGFKVVWANEFVPIAQQSYKANAAADSILDGRDIRQIKVEDILKSANLKVGELDIFDGSPPCQAFSTAGKREKGWGKAKQYEHGAKQCNEQLFWDYIRLLDGLKPKFFVAENVSGLLKGTAKGMFLEIMRDLKACGYNVKCKLLDAQWLGVPQARQRAIFIGARNDLVIEPQYPVPLKYRYSVRDAIPWIVEQPSNSIFDDSKELMKTADEPSRTITASGHSASRCVALKIEPETDISRYAIGNEWEKLKQGEQSDKYFSLIRVDSEKPSPTIMASSGNYLSAAQPLHPIEKRKFTIAELKRICSFPDDFVLCGTYGQQWERLGNSVPPLMMKQVADVLRKQLDELKTKQSAV